ncbi:MAG: hypothetical protein JWO80_3397 [Bryobacterales bacterium]|nr:hypothetical protein [Bryobacterales bacterium]
MIRGLHQAALLIAFASALPSLLPAQATAVSGPSVAYVFDAPTSSIRPLIGVAGSSFLGDPSLTGLQFAAVAPNGVAAIAAWGDRVEWITDLSNYPQSSSVIGGALASPDQILWDRKSSAVVVFSSSSGQLQFIQLAGGVPALQNVVRPDSCLGSVKLLAADAANGIAAVGCTPAPDAPDSQNLFFLQMDSSARLVQTPDAPVSAAFAENGSFYIAGRNSTIAVVGNAATDSSAQLLFSEPDAQNGASAILVQSAAQLLYSADSVQRRIRVYDLGSFAKVDDLPLDWLPMQFQPFPSNSFLINTRSKASEPMILLQTAPKRALLFVPAGE